MIYYIAVLLRIFSAEICVCRLWKIVAGWFVCLFIYLTDFIGELGGGEQC